MKRLLPILLLAGCNSEMPANGDDVQPGDDGRAVDARATDGREPDAAHPDGGPSQLDVYQSGSRLKMRVGTTPDGAKTFLGWRDTMRSEDCSFVLASDGVLRCVPGAVASYTPDVFWGDAACTTVRLATTPTGCVTSGYARSVSTCVPSRFTIYALGAHYQGTVYVKSGATCTSFTGSSEYYVLGAEIPPAGFVDATESLE